MVMHSELRRISIMAFAITVLFAGCQRRIEDRPTSATADSYRDKIDFQALPAETRRLYDRVVTGKLTGTSAGDVQNLLDTAQRKTQGEVTIRYDFQMNHFDRPFDQAFEEGIPILSVAVEKASGRIYYCELSAPEY